ncbi:MAG: radical SAM protein [Candidatus Omnitrophica bacterium]|nr:radical SAM protein [Candidatus Omnitrophota bacterium]
MFHLLVSDKSGKIFDIPELEAAGMKAGCFFRPGKREFIKIPEASRLFMLPGRMPVGYDRVGGKFKALENYFAVAAFVAPAFTGTYSAAYHFPPTRWDKSRCVGGKALPLYCYTLAGFYKGDIYVTAIRVDKSSRHDPKFINIDSVRKNAIKIKKLFPANRLIRHLQDCAMIHGCPGAQNFFLSREECPLPVSPSCNANCAGCISLETQPRIKFTPSPEEVAELALFHICNVKNTVVGGRDRLLLSFGQGCEGEPLLEAELIEESIRLIRTKTHKGTINMNTNASRPEALARLFDTGLDSIRVSMNSVRKEYYERYYKPAGYNFQDVLKSIKTAKQKKGFVSINYLTMPGFTDSKDEFAALKKFIETYKIDMIQWRNLNFDPLHYFKIIKYSGQLSAMVGVRQLITSLKKSFPSLKMGYYNPSL